ncbi:TetR/AcrR family transcriptional regulator [Nocardiopsis sp. NPDC058631]|uniref:TetR/AcrR family transcriptional regulator n=1 Tax=Nocardiopsis sp. NPDC058631 TaxID=3346566 RepID=UPI00365680D2
MPRAQSDTKAEIQAVALDLFARKGFERTSLREIAERLGITKAALYYHFPSKNDLLKSLVEPLVQDMGDLFATYGDEPEEIPEGGPGRARELLGDYFDICVRHRTLLVAVLDDVGSLAAVGLIDAVVAWRRRLDRLLAGPDRGVPARMGAVIALGGIQDVSVRLSAEEALAHREHALDSALAALVCGISQKD